MTKFWTAETALNVVVSVGTGFVVGTVSGLMGASDNIAMTIAAVTVIPASLIWGFITGK